MQGIFSTLVAGSFCWFVVSSLWVYPHSLSYFNESIGGPLNGAEHLLGSNVDWGQDGKYIFEHLQESYSTTPKHIVYIWSRDWDLKKTGHRLFPVTALGGHFLPTSDGGSCAELIIGRGFDLSGRISDPFMDVDGYIRQLSPKVLALVRHKSHFSPVTYAVVSYVRIF